jgi:predicted CoA-binding protein
MEKSIKEFLEQESFAIAGSFKDDSKYAYKILLTLKMKGRKVFPVNPNKKDVDGEPCFRVISDIPMPVDVVVLVTPPAVTERIVEECFELGIKRVWMQPGAENERAIRYCQDNSIKVVHDLCVMLEAQ